MLCKSTVCNFIVHPDKKNNGGEYCCRSCKKDVNTHGDCCKKILAKCRSADCIYSRHSNAHWNNGGEYCCFCCLSLGSHIHGPYCARNIYGPDLPDVKLTPQYRISHYTKNIVKKIFNIKSNELEDCAPGRTFKTKKILMKGFVNNEQRKSEMPQYIMPYAHDMVTYFDYLDDTYNDKPVYLIFGDSTRRLDYSSEISQIAKVRLIEEENRTVVLNLDAWRHSAMLPKILDEDIPFSQKDNKLIWRGISTGCNFRHDQRDIVVKKYQNNPNPDIDIKFTNLVQGKNNNNNEYTLGNWINRDTQLKSRFLLSVEGNDVATNLKWILISNSVCIMAVPKVMSWFMEDHLVPYQHYVPVRDDFEDLEDRYKWCLNNLDTCEQISKNAKKFMKQFMDPETEKQITKSVLEVYFDNMQIGVE